MVKMGFGIEDIKANPTFFAAIIVAVIGIVIAAYGHFAKKTKWITFTGIGVMVAALLVAVISHFRKGQAPENGTAGRCPTNTVGPPTGTASTGVSTPL